MPFLSDLPTALWALPPLAVALGIDLYLTVLLLGVASLTALELPGGLVALGYPLAPVMAAVLYVTGIVMARWPSADLLWSVAHLVVKPLAAGLLTVLLLEGEEPGVVALAATVAVLVVLQIQSWRIGGRLMVRLGSERPPSALLTGLLEDVLVLGILAVAVQGPPVSTGVASGVAALSVLAGGSVNRGTRFSLRLLRGRIAGGLFPRRWIPAGELPTWVRRVADDPPPHVSTVRALPAGACRLPSGRRFERGWMTVSRSQWLFLHRRGREVGELDLASLPPPDIDNRGVCSRMRFDGPGKRSLVLLLPADGPDADALYVELLGSDE